PTSRLARPQPGACLGRLCDSCDGYLECSGASLTDRKRKFRRKSWHKKLDRQRFITLEKRKGRKRRCAHFSSFRYLSALGLSPLMKSPKSSMPKEEQKK